MITQKMERIEGKHGKGHDKAQKNDKHDKKRK
jgi:hypothetical protein